MNCTKQQNVIVTGLKVSEFLPENTIGVCSENSADNYSIKSIVVKIYFPDTKHKC